MNIVLHHLAKLFVRPKTYSVCTVNVHNNWNVINAKCHSSYFYGCNLMQIQLFWSSMAYMWIFQIW